MAKDRTASQLRSWQDPRIRDERLAGIRAYRERVRIALALLERVEGDSTLATLLERDSGPVDDSGPA